MQQQKKMTTEPSDSRPQKRNCSFNSGDELVETGCGLVQRSGTGGYVAVRGIVQESSIDNNVDDDDDDDDERDGENFSSPVLIPPVQHQRRLQSDVLPIAAQTVRGAVSLPAANLKPCSALLSAASTFSPGKLAVSRSVETRSETDDRLHHPRVQSGTSSAAVPSDIACSSTIADTALARCPSLEENEVRSDEGNLSMSHVAFDAPQGSPHRQNAMLLSF